MGFDAAMRVEFRKALVLSPHTDDAIIGAGGLMNTLAKQGTHIVHVVFTTCNETLAGTKFKSGEIAREDREAATMLGAREIVHHEFENRFLQRSRQEILDTIYPFREDPELDLVIAPFTGDVHQDHKTVAEEALRAFGRNGATLIHYPIIGTCKGFDPTLFVPLTSEVVDLKLKALSCYKTQFELRNSWFNLDNFKAKLRYNGVFINTEFAEAFVLAKGTWGFDT